MKSLTIPNLSDSSIHNSFAAFHICPLIFFFPFTTEGSHSYPIKTQESRQSISISFSMDVLRRIMLFITLIINLFNF